MASQSLTLQSVAITIPTKVADAKVADAKVADAKIADAKVADAKVATVAFYTVFGLIFCCLFPVAITELVIGFTWEITTVACMPIMLSSATWLIVTGFSTFFLMCFAILGGYCAIYKLDGCVFICKAFSWTLIAFKFAWTIVGAVMVWKYCTDISGTSIYVMMTFSVIYGLLEIYSHLHQK
jgi:hypothetical protein